MEWLIQKLEYAAESLQSVSNTVPLYLGPVLILLSRLLPIEEPPVKTKPFQDPSLLIPHIQSNSTSAVPLFFMSSQDAWKSHIWPFEDLLHEH